MKLQAEVIVTHDSDMAKQYLSITEFADRIGVTRGSMSNRDNLPEPDVVIGSGQRATRGWSEATIDKWNESRPGSGNWGPKKSAKRGK